MKKILIPTDFSPNAEKALNYAAEIATLSGADIIILHVTDLTHTSLNENVILPESFDREIIESAHEKLAVLAAAVKDITHTNVETLLYNGFIADAIIKASQENDVDLVVMGTLGDSGIREKLFGSITAKIISHSNIPVLAIPLLCEWEPPQSILLAINHFKESPEIIEPVIELASLFKANINITIFTDEDDSGPIDYIQNKKNILLFCSFLKQAHPGLNILPTPVYGHHFEEAIKTFIADNGTDVLAMVTHKRNFIESIFHKSMTKKMSYHSNIPLLSMPAH